MRELPILFNAPMVRAIQDGTKTQTRRVLKLPHGYWETSPNGLVPIPVGCPYGQAGDRLWVREAFAELQGTGIEHRQPPDFALQRYAYAADSRPGSASDEARKDYGIRWKPSIHMPRAASRISLEVTGVRVERLQAISEADARAEGARFHDGLGIGHSGWRHDDGAVHDAARSAFARLWESLHGAGSWAVNPWVWVISFRRVMP